MKQIILIILVGFSVIAGAQTTQTPEQIRQQMAKVRQSTNWDDPAAAKKANEEIKRLANLLSGGKSMQIPANGQQQQTSSTKPALSAGSVIQTAATKENIVAIAERYYQRSYLALDAITKTNFNQDFKAADKDNFNLKAIRRLTSNGGVQITMGDDHNLACVYLAAAVRAMPTDTLSINNFGAYLRIIDSLQTALTVLLYANKLYSGSPIILTQIGCSYFELNDVQHAEFYLKEALKNDPGFGQAHTALCELYIKQNKLREALLELFAGVKGMGASYNRALGNYSYLQQQAEKEGPNSQDTKETFWNETRNQIRPEDALVPLERSVDRLKMPAFPSCLMLADWIEGGGYASAVQAYGRLTKSLRKFAEELQKANKELPDLPANAILRDYPNERFALECITEYFFRESQEEYDDFKEKVDEIMSEVNDESESYFQNKERYTQEYVKTAEKCNFEPYCLNECKRVFCTQDCPATDKFNKQLQSRWEQYLKTFRETLDNQKKILEDMYEFTAQWYSRIESPYWSKIYAYEIQRVALTIIGNAYSAYQMPFPGPVHTDCGPDCSVYANPYPIPAEEVEEKEPKANNCPEDKKANIGLAMCSFSFDCESVEFGCAAGAAFSIKRNFKNKSTTSFFGAGAEGGIGFVKASATAGVTMTKYDSGDIDIGVKAEGSFTGGGPVSTGKNYEVNVTVMEGLKTETKTVFGLGF